MQITTNKAVSCKFSSVKGLPYDSMDGFFDLNFETVHKKTFVGLQDGVYRYFIKCKDFEGQVSKELETVFGVALPVEAQIFIEGGHPVGKGKVLESGKVEPVEVKVGDIVLYGKYSGTEITKDGEDYLIVKEEDILAVIKK